MRVWPKPERDSHVLVPDAVRTSVGEANLCHVAGAHTATAAMCGRALEAICVHHRTKEKNLANALRELLDRDVIDERLFKWSEELRRRRNLAAHATGTEVSKQDAADLLDFLNAICEYVFVLTPKFEAFMKRKAARKG